MEFVIANAMSVKGVSEVAKAFEANIFVVSKLLASFVIIETQDF